MTTISFLRFLPSRDIGDTMPSTSRKVFCSCNCKQATKHGKLSFTWPSRAEIGSAGSEGHPWTWARPLDFLTIAVR